MVAAAREVEGRAAASKAAVVVDTGRAEEGTAGLEVAEAVTVAVAREEVVGVAPLLEGMATATAAASQEATGEVAAGRPTPSSALPSAVARSGSSGESAW